MLILLYYPANVLAASCTIPNGVTASIDGNASVEVTKEAQIGLIRRVDVKTPVAVPGLPQTVRVTFYDSNGKEATFDVNDARDEGPFDPNATENFFRTQAYYAGTKGTEHYFNIPSSAKVKYHAFYTINASGAQAADKTLPYDVGFSFTIDKNQLEDYDGIGELKGTLHLLSWYSYTKDIPGLSGLLREIGYQLWYNESSPNPSATYLVKDPKIYITCDIGIDAASAHSLQDKMPTIEHELKSPTTIDEVKKEIDGDSSSTCGTPNTKTIVSWIPCFIAELSYKLFYALMGWNWPPTNPT